MTAKYDIEINRGSEFQLWLQYLTDGNTAVNLSPYDAELQIKRYRGGEYPVLFATENGLTYGYTGGFTTGVAGIGGLSLNTNYDGTSTLGGILIKFDYNTTENLSAGKYFYDLKLLVGNTFAQRLVEGRATVIDGVVL